MATATKKRKLPSGRHQSQIKRQRQNQKIAERNRVVRSETRTYIKKVREAVLNDGLETAKKILQETIRKVDKAVSKGIFHRNKGSRIVSRLSKLVSSLTK